MVELEDTNVFNGKKIYLNYMDVDDDIFEGYFDTHEELLDWVYHNATNEGKDRIFLVMDAKVEELSKPESESFFVTPHVSDVINPKFENYFIMEHFGNEMHEVIHYLIDLYNFDTEQFSKYLPRISYN